jgi:hypothetical protein
MPDLTEAIMNVKRGSARQVLAGVVLFAAVTAISLVNRGHEALAQAPPAPVDRAAQNSQRMFREGRHIFRFDTFGSEAFWGDRLKLHLAIAGSALGGVGPGLSPTMALSLGLKVDSEALPAALVQQIRRGEVNLNDPATTVTLLRQNAVVGVTAFFNEAGGVRSVGIQCAICHSTVDDSARELCPPSVQPNVGTGCIGRRLDGWPNRDLNIGAIVALAPDVSPYTTLLGVNESAVRQVLQSWGPGKFDAELILDGKTTNPNTGRSAATLLPAAFGLAGVNLHTWTGGWGTVTYWNAFVSNLEMQGKGTLFDPRLNNAEQFPVSARAGFGNKRDTPDLITAKLPALHYYQLSIPAPDPPAGLFDRQAAQRGETLFSGRAACATCHVTPLFTEPGWNAHKPAEICIDDFQANRSPDRSYRTAPLRGLFAHQKGGFYHDGRFATLGDVVDHYNGCRNLGLSAAERNDLVQFLLSLGGSQPAMGATPVIMLAPVASPTLSNEVALDASRSFDPGGDALTFSWRPIGTPVPGIVRADTATPSLQFPQMGDFTVEVTATNASGRSSTERITIRFAGRP